MTETSVRAPAPPGLLYAMADQRRNQLDARDAQTLAELRRHLGAAAAQAEAALADVTKLLADTPPELRSPAWLYQQARYKNALATIEQAYAAAGPGGVAAITDAQRWAQAQGALDAAAMGSQAAGVRAGDFVGVNPANLTTAVGFLADGSPVSGLFASYGAAAVTNASQVLSSAALLGWGADKTAREFRRTVTGMTQTRADTLARTELHRVYRATSRDTYHANADVVTGWVWLAKLDTRTCSSCIAMSGTMHQTADTLDGHPRCRCVMVPITGPWQAIDPRLGELKDTRAAVPTGADWLRAQPKATQKAVLGPTKYGLYARGQIDMEDLVTRVQDPVWGTMRREATVAEARAAAAARGVRQTFPRTRAKTPAKTQQDRRDVAAKLAEAKRLNAATAELEANRPAQSDTVYAALQPKHGGWTTTRRAQTTAAMKDPEARKLLKTLDSFQSGGATAIPRMRTDIKALLSGEHTLAPGRVDALENLLGAIANSEAGPRTLYRGMRLPGTVDDVLASYAPGTSHDLALASFSSDPKLAQSFSVRGAGQKATRQLNVPVVVEWTGETKRALPLENLGKSRVFGQEREWLGAGQYVVKGAKVAKRGGVDTVVVTMEQVSTL